MSKLMKNDCDAKRDPYAITRKIYPFESMFEYLCAILSSGSFLAKLSISLGINDSITALIGTLSSLVCIIQLLSGRMARHTPIKPWLVPIALVTRLCMVGMFLLPFLHIGSLVDIVLLVLVFVAQATSMLIAPVKQSMFLTTVSEKDRMRYLAGHGAVSLCFAIPLILFGGVFLDKMEESGKLALGFLIVACAIFFFCICHITTLIIAKEPPMKKSETKSVFADIGSLMKNEKFRTFFIIMALHSIANGTLAPYLNTYVQREFEFSLGLANAFTAAQSVLYLVGLMLVQRLGRRLKPATLYSFYFLSYALYDAIWLIMSKENALILHFPLVLVGSVVNATFIAYTPILLSTVGEEEHTSAIAVCSAMMGVLAFLTTLVITPFFDLMQANGVHVLGISLYAQQVLAMISVSLRFVVFVFWVLQKKRFREA